MTEVRLRCTLAALRHGHPHSWTRNRLAETCSRVQREEVLLGFNSAKDARREAGSRPGEAEVDFPLGEVKAGPGTGPQIQDMVLAQARTRRKQTKGRSGASTSAGATSYSELTRARSPRSQPTTESGKRDAGSQTRDFRFVAGSGSCLRVQISGRVALGLNLVALVYGFNSSLFPAAGASSVQAQVASVAREEGFVFPRPLAQW